jgi:plastocyanin
LFPETKMRRVFALLLLTPLLANCSDSAMPVAPAGAVLSEGDVPTEVEWPAEENWWTPEDMISLPDEEISTLAAPATNVVMTFGNPDAGTAYPPGTHDASFHGKDRVIPGTVVIDAGQTVKFMVLTNHRVAIYKPGVRPEDITATNPGPFILTPSTGRLALQAAPGNPVFQFNVPGRYLVICAVKNHFFVANMYGWVIVR